MITAHSNNSQTLVTLKQASETLGVTIETLLSWNEHNILKPTITKSGEIGYTQQQIDQFLTIQRLTAANALQMPAGALQETPQRTLLGEDFAHVDLKSQIRTQTKHRGIKSSQLVLSAAAIVALVTTAVFLPQESNKRTLAQGEHTPNFAERLLGMQTSKLKLPGQFLATLPVSLKQEETREKNLHNEGENVSKEKITAPKLYAKAPAEKNQEAPIALPRKTGMNNASSGDTYASTALFQDPAEEEAAIDANGNIKGEAKTDTLDAIVGGLEGMVTNGGQMNADVTNQIMLFLLGGFVLFLGFHKQVAWAYGGKRLQTQQREPILPTYQPQVVALPEKLLEVDQKTDGTVVLFFMGKEYKISKPEMNSESDQFIERLMSLAQTDVKEFEYNYDVFSNESMKFTTPLSRLVTRLGFVGIKRDLFFPRTSKNSVLFRRYITQQDLSAMNLTIDQIRNELLS